MKEIILEEYRKGNVVVANLGGIKTMKLEDIIKQPAEGILYDLNRLESVILSFLPDPKWINDYAASQVIRELKKRIKELEDGK